MLIIRRSKLYYTASGIITPVGGRPVHGLRAEALSRAAQCEGSAKCAESEYSGKQRIYFLRATDFKLLSRIKVTKLLRLFKVCYFCYGRPFWFLAPALNKPTSYANACRVMWRCDHCLADCNQGYATTSVFCISESWFINMFRVQDWGLKNLQALFFFRCAIPFVCLNYKVR